MVIQKRVHELMATCLAAAGNHETPLTQAWIYWLLHNLYIECQLSMAVPIQACVGFVCCDALNDSHFVSSYVNL